MWTGLKRGNDCLKRGDEGLKKDYMDIKIYVFYFDLSKAIPAMKGARLRTERKKI